MIWVVSIRRQIRHPEHRTLTQYKNIKMIPINLQCPQSPQNITTAMHCISKLISEAIDSISDVYKTMLSWDLALDRTCSYSQEPMPTE